MKYTKHLQLLFEKNLSIGSLNKDDSINVTLKNSMWKIWKEKDLLHIAITDGESTEAPDYTINIDHATSIEDILLDIKNKLKNKSGLQDADRQERSQNIENITPNEKKQLGEALQKLLKPNQNKVAA